MTDEQKKKKSQWMAEYKLRMKLAGLCTGCGKRSPVPERLKCEQCIAASRKSVRTYRLDRRNKRPPQGQCSCGSIIAELGRRTCDPCRDRNRKNYQEKKLRGQCTYCGNQSRVGATRCQECAGKLRRKGRDLRAVVFHAYGGPKCACCGEENICFLTLDHMNNDGNKHRRSVGRTSVLKWSLDHDFPPGFQVLCFNCNMGKHFNKGICPHRDPHLSPEDTISVRQHSN